MTRSAHAPSPAITMQLACTDLSIILVLSLGEPMSLHPTSAKWVVERTRNPRPAHIDSLGRRDHENQRLSRARSGGGAGGPAGRWLHPRCLRRRKRRVRVHPELATETLSEVVVTAGSNPGVDGSFRSGLQGSTAPPTRSWSLEGVPIVRPTHRKGTSVGNAPRVLRGRCSRRPDRTSRRSMTDDRPAA